MAVPHAAEKHAPDEQKSMDMSCDQNLGWHSVAPGVRSQLNKEGIGKEKETHLQCKKIYGQLIAKTGKANQVMMRAWKSVKLAL